MKKKILLLFWDGWLGISPSLINGIRLLVKAGYSVEIILGKRKLEFVDPPEFKDNVKLIYIPISELKYKNYKNKTWSRFYFNCDYFFSRLRFFFYCIKNSLTKKSHIIIGIDKEGSVFAGILSLLYGVGYIYWSLEISYINQSEFSMDKLFKRFERVFHRKALFTIVQDEYRAQSLMKENSIHQNNYVIVPNGPMGSASELEGDYFQKKFGLSKSQKLILHLGIIDASAMSLELAKDASEWSDEFKLVFHEREFKTPEQDKYLQKVIEAGKGRALFSLEPVDYDQLDKVASSADIGLVIYDKKFGPNYSLISGASGKVGHYLRCGLPIICLDLPGFKEIIYQYKCGLLIKNLNEIEDSIKKIFSNYSKYREDAFICYKEIYEFSGFFSDVIDRIEKLK